MPFIPLSAGFPRVSAGEQAARDAEAEQILRAEFAQDMPDENRAALEAEYQRRFGKEPPPTQRGFIPLANAGTAGPQRGFIPLDSGEAAGPSTVQRAAMAAEPYVTPALKTVQAVASGYPVAETAANLLTMGAALPAAGLAGIGTAAARALGLTDKEPADVVHAVSGAMTYQPKTELGQHLTGAAMYPFEMLAKGGAAAGDKVLDATGSPVAATAVDTTINALPMAIAPAARGIQTARARFAPTVEPVQIDPVAKVRLATTPDEMIAAIGELRQSIDGTMDILQSLPPIPEIMPPAIPRAIVPTPGMPSAGLAPSGMIAPAVNAGARPGFIPAPDVAMVQRPAIAEAPAATPPAAMEAAPRPTLAPAPVKAPSPAELVAEPRPAPGIEATPQIQRGFIPLENIDAQPIPAGIRRLAPDDQAMLGPDRQGLEELRGPGRKGLPAVAEQLPDVPQGRGVETGTGPVALAGEARHPGELRAGERGLAEPPAADFAPAVLPPDQLGRGIADHPGSRAADRLAPDDLARPAAETRDGAASRDIPGAAALPERLEVPDSRRADPERAGMGEAVGREGADPAREAAPRATAGTGIEAGEPPLSGFVPLRDSIDAAAHDAAASPLNDRPQPTSAQIDAGNYKKGAVRLHGMDISIENPAGSVRRGTDASGRAWETEMRHHYGYIKNSLAKDGDHVDVFIGNAAMLIDKSVKNEARLKVARLSQLGGGRFMVKIDAESRPVKISGDQVIGAMLKKYGIAIDGDAPAFFEFLIKGQPPAGNNVVAVMQGGKPVWFEVGDPILYRALKAVDRPVQSEVVRWLGLPKRIGQLTITATPDFWMANIARDTLMGSVMSRAGFRPIIDSLQGMTLRLTKDPLYRDYLANGGGLSSIFLEEKHLRTKLESYYREQGIDYRTVLDTPDKLLTMVETLGDAFEMSTRLGEYQRAIERGENPRHAAYMGREVSTDFAMKGDSKALGFMYDTVMFLRPALVSWDRLYRGLAHDPNKGAIAAKAGMMALSSAGLYLLNRDDPRYKDLPDWDRDANWHFFIGDQHFRWLKAWELGALSSAAERTVEKIMAEDPQGLGKDFLRIMRATFSVNFMPQIIAPLAEQATNRNSFTKAPIETPGMENVQPFLRAKPGTSETMKAIGMATRDMPEALQINPARAEALLRGYFNTYALYGLMLSDQALFGDKLPEKRTDELPVVRRFYSQEPAKHTKYETVFYDLLQESKRLRGTMRELDEMGLRGYADAKEKEPLATESKPLERAAKSLSVINNEVQAVRRDVDLTPAEKRQKLDALTVERNALVKAAVTESKAAQKERDK